MSLWMKYKKVRIAGKHFVSAKNSRAKKNSGKNFTIRKPFSIYLTKTKKHVAPIIHQKDNDFQIGKILKMSGKKQET